MIITAKWLSLLFLFTPLRTKLVSLSHFQKSKENKNLLSTMFQNLWDSWLFHIFNMPVYDAHWRPRTSNARSAGARKSWVYFPRTYYPQWRYGQSVAVSCHTWQSHRYIPSRDVSAAWGNGLPATVWRTRPGDCAGNRVSRTWMGSSNTRREDTEQEQTHSFLKNSLSEIGIKKVC